MKLTSEILAQPHLSVLARTGDHELGRIAALLDHKTFVDGRTELEVRFGELLALDAPPTPKTLDLIGHSTPGTALLVLGDWVIDAASAAVTAFFREIAEQRVLPRLGVEAVRLLGCLTADTGHGRWTICTLAEILGVEVYGTTDLIYSGHYDSRGFAHERRYLLASASALRVERSDVEPTAGIPSERLLDLDGLPASNLSTPSRWLVRLASGEDARQFLRLVRRRSGATMPGLLTVPTCEVVLPSRQPDRYHRIQVLMDGAFVRVYPDGDDRPGILYPVEEPRALRQLCERLPTIIGSSD